MASIDKVAMNKTILIMVLTYHPLPMGGAEIQSMRLARKLVNRGMKPLILTQGAKNLPKFEIIDGICVHRVYSVLHVLKDLFYSLINKIIRPQERKITITQFDEVSKRYGRLFSFRGVGWYVLFFMGSAIFFIKKRREVSLIQVGTIELLSVIAAFWGKLLNKKVIVKDSTMNGLTKLKFAPFGSLIQKYIMRNCHFVAMTKAIEDNYIRTGISRDRISRIPNGIEIVNVQRQDKSFKYKCLFVGNLSQQPAKGVDILLRAWRNISAKFPEAGLTIVGDGNTSDYYEFVKNSGLEKSVYFAGSQKPENYYLDSDIFVLPSRREGMSNALLEAMVYKMAIIATNISGNQDLIVDGVNGKLVPAEDVDALSEAIELLFNDPNQCKELGLKARKTVEQLCDLNDVADQYIQLYKKLVTF